MSLCWWQLWKRWKRGRGEDWRKSFNTGAWTDLSIRPKATRWRSGDSLKFGTNEKDRRCGSVRDEAQAYLASALRHTLTASSRSSHQQHMNENGLFFFSNSKPNTHQLQTGWIAVDVTQLHHRLQCFSERRLMLKLGLLWQWGKAKHPLNRGCNEDGFQVEEANVSNLGLWGGVKPMWSPRCLGWRDNYLHGRLLFLHGWVGCCMSAAEARGALH